MKKMMLSLVALMFVTLMFAQNSGLGFNYQAVVRRADGVLLSNSDVTLRISLYPGKSAATPTWVESHKVHTDVSGSFGITVGKGTPITSGTTFADINFAAVYYWMKIELLDGSNYREVSFAQLPSTPYSEVAHNAAAFPGMIAPFAGPEANIPAGWLLCNGAAVNRSKYSNLYDAIGISWGAGDGSTTFNLPDLRGMFLRGTSGASGNDVDADQRKRLKEGDGGNIGNNVGSYQPDAIRNITGAVGGAEEEIFTTGAFYSQPGTNWGSGHKSDYDNATAVFDASRVVQTGSDNRPQNVYVTYIIKY